MSVLEGLQPEKVFYYFEDICSIPHGSRNTKLISDYVVAFAKRHGFRYVQDEYNNVIIYKPSTGASEDTVILQGHLDMVCEKEEDCDIDFELEGLRLEVQDDLISADGTTLGGDDGIAVAYMLAILDSDDIIHPNLECVFTVDEEIGMLGANALDMSLLKGRKLLNIDSEEEGHLLVSCAGGATAEIRVPILRRGAKGKRFQLTVSGLTGGHSGTEIDKGRANADIIMGRILSELLILDDSMKLISISGGLKDNAIPVKAEADIITDRYDELEPNLTGIFSKIREDYADSDPDMKLGITASTKTELYPLDELQNLGFIMAYGKLPYGVTQYSEDIEGLVQTSLNLGIMETTENELKLIYSVRSSVSDEKKALLEELEMIARSLGASFEIEGEYPAWEYVKDSKVRNIMLPVYKEMSGKDMIVEAIHAGLECGIFSDALEGLDAVSFGPDIYDIHTPKERLSISSVSRTWEYIKAVLAKF